TTEGTEDTEETNSLVLFCSASSASSAVQTKSTRVLRGSRFSIEPRIGLARGVAALRSRAPARGDQPGPSHNAGKPLMARRLGRRRDGHTRCLTVDGADVSSPHAGASMTTPENRR